MRKPLFVLLSSMATFAATGFGTAHAVSMRFPAPQPTTFPAPFQLSTILTCHFEKEGQKGEPDQECSASFAQPLVRASDARPTSPNNEFIVKCDDDTVYDGGGFTQTGEFTGSPQFGFGIVTAINTSIQPTYPSVFVDGDFQDFTSGFTDRDARLYFAEDRFIRGKCDHPGIVR